MTAVSRGMGQADVQVCIASDGSCSGTPTVGAIPYSVQGTGPGTAGGTEGSGSSPNTSTGGTQSLWAYLFGPGGMGYGPGAGLPGTAPSGAPVAFAWMTLILFGVAVFVAYKVTEGR